MALGRGLSALIVSTASKKISADTDRGESRVWHIPVSAIAPNARQPRRHFDAAELQNLASSIKEHGILQPLLVTERPDGGYEIVAGERRLRAAQIAGLPTVPALVRKMEDQQKLEVALIENIQREDLNSIEEAFAYRRLTDEFGMTQGEVAQKVGKARPTVTNVVRLLDLPEPAQKALVDKKINLGQAKVLLSLSGEESRLEMLSSMLGQKITVQELTREVNKKRTNKNIIRRDPNLLYLEEKMRAALGTRVNITQRGERGVVGISYYSKEELGRIVKKITEEESVISAE